MTNPIHRNQKVFLHNNTPANLGTHKNPNLNYKDTLRTQAAGQDSSFCSTLFDAIGQFFQTIYNLICCMGPANTNAKITEIASRDNFVWFYKKEENPLTAFLGNFHPCTIRLWGLEFKCAEAAYQAAKFSPNQATMKRFQYLDGEGAFRLGQQLTQAWNPQQQSQWQRVNVGVMRDVVQAKFAQNPDLKANLLATGNAYLVEHIPSSRRKPDAFWGDGSNGNGANHLGRILMDTRANLGGGRPVGKNHQYDQFISNLR